MLTDNKLATAISADILLSTRLTPTAERLLQASDAERAAFLIQDHLVRYPALEVLIAQAEWMLYEPQQTRARGLVVCSARGNGKTSIANLIHARHRDYDNSSLPCVVKISMSGVRNARAVHGRAMEVLGSPARISHRLSDRELIVQRLLSDVGCRLLVLDEVQDILLGSEREQQRALEGIKLLMNELGLPVMAFGTEKAAQGFNADPHLAARFKTFELPLWEDNQVLANFLATYERTLPLHEASNLASPANVALLVKVGKGLLGPIVERIQNAALTAILDGSEAISEAHLKTAVSRPATCLLAPIRKKAA